MNESELIALIGKYRGGRLTSVERARLAELLEDPAARRLLVRDMTLESALRGTLRVARSAGAEVARVRGAGMRNDREHVRPWPRILSLAAAALLVVGGGLWLWNAERGARIAESGNRGAESPVVIRVVAVNAECGMRNAEGASRPLKVGDVVSAGGRIETGKEGSVRLAWAGEATTLELGKASDFSVQGSGKTLRLDRGQLTAMVAKQEPGKPLVIETPHARATVLGTRFSLAAGSKETQVNVAEGRVQVESLASRAAGSVAAGQSVVVPAGASEPLVVLGEVVFVEEFDGGLDGWNVFTFERISDPPRVANEEERKAISIQTLEREGRKVKCLVVDGTGGGGRILSVESKRSLAEASTVLQVFYKVVKTAGSGEMRAIVGSNTDRDPVRTEVRKGVDPKVQLNQWTLHDGHTRILAEKAGGFSVRTDSRVNGRDLGGMINHFDGDTAPRLIPSVTAARATVAVDRFEVRRLISIIQPAGAKP